MRNRGGGRAKCNTWLSPSCNIYLKTTTTCTTCVQKMSSNYTNKHKHTSPRSHGRICRLALFYICPSNTMLEKCFEKTWALTWNQSTARYTANPYDGGRNASVEYVWMLYAFSLFNLTSLSLTESEIEFSEIFQSVRTHAEILIN